jgi:hypothetical protein
MKKQKRTKRKVVKVKAKKVKPLKLKINKIPINQYEDLEAWLKHHKDTGKLPHNRVVCSVCKMDFIGLKGIGMAHAMKKFDGNIKRILTESVCKNCKPKPEVEKKERVVELLTREQMQARRDAISETLPKIDFHKERTVYDIGKHKDMCKQYTYFACHRPDIYLDYGCEECSIKKHCACPIKDVNRVADGRHKMKKKK